MVDLTAAAGGAGAAAAAGGAAAGAAGAAAAAADGAERSCEVAAAILAKQSFKENDIMEATR